MDLDEFTDEIEPWIIDELKAIGCDTAKSVLDLPIDDLVARTDLEEETIRRSSASSARNSSNGTRDENVHLN